MLFRSFDTAPAVAFLDDFCRPPWTLAAWRGERLIETKQCGTRQEAAGFFSKHRGSMLRVLLGYSRPWCPSGPEPNDLIMAAGVAVAIPTTKLSALPVPPAVWIEGPGHGVAAWRFLTPVHAAAARRMIVAFANRFAAAARCRCDPLPLMMPIPGVGSGFELGFQRKGEAIDLLAFDGASQSRRPARPKDEDEEFVRGDQARADRGIPTIKKGWVPAESIALFLGREKQGKSLAVAKLASYITSGGSWEPGGWRAGWWDGEPVAPEARGSAIICEEEDPRLETLARLRAAGCDMSKVHVRMMVPDISAPRQLKQITGLAEALGDCRMISFSPLSSALLLRNYTEPAVRDKLRPLQKWLRGRFVVVIGIVHLDTEGRATGSAVIPRVCRSGISFDYDEQADKGAMRRMLANNAKMGVSVSYRIEGATAMIGGTPIDTARILFR